jgi:hypothetical protein
VVLVVAVFRTGADLAALVDRDVLADRVVLAAFGAVGLAPAVVFAAAARVAAGLVVACFAAAIVVLLLPPSRVFAGLVLVRFDLDVLPTTTNFAVSGISRRMSLAVAFPAGIFRVPRLIALTDAVEGPLGFGRRVVGTEPVLRRTFVGLGLDPLMGKAPVVPISTAVAHDITVHRK